MSPAARSRRHWGQRLRRGGAPGPGRSQDGGGKRSGAGGGFELVVENGTVVSKKVGEDGDAAVRKASLKDRVVDRGSEEGGEEMGDCREMLVAHGLRASPM